MDEAVNVKYEVSVVGKGKLMHQSEFVNQNYRYGQQKQIRSQKVSRVKHFLQDLFESRDVIINVQWQIDQHEKRQVQHLYWMDVHLVIFPISEDEVTIIKYLQVPEEHNNNDKLQRQLLHNLDLVIPRDFNNCKYMADERFGREHLFLVFCQYPVYHQEAHPDDIILSDIQ